MLNNWLEIILDFDFEIVHRPGILHVLPDAISRLYDKEDRPQQNNEVRVWSSNSDSISLKDTLPTEVVREDLREILLQRAHAQGHFGAEAAYKALFYNGHHWPTMRKDCNLIVRTCIPCQRFNIGKHGYHPLTSILVM